MATDFLHGVYNQASIAFPAVAYYTEAETRLYIDVRPGVVRLVVWHPSELHVPLVRMETGFSDSVTNWLPAVPQSSEPHTSMHANNTGQLVCTVLTLADAAARTSLPRDILEDHDRALAALITSSTVPARCLDNCAWVYRAAVLTSWLAARSGADAARTFFLQELRWNTPSMHMTTAAVDVRANPLATASMYNNYDSAISAWDSIGQTGPLPEAVPAEGYATGAFAAMLRTSYIPRDVAINTQRQRETYLSAQSTRAGPAEIRAYLNMTASDGTHTCKITPVEKSLETSVSTVLLLVTDLTNEDLEKLLVTLQCEQRRRAATRQGVDHPGLRSLSKVRIPTGKQ